MGTEMLLFVIVLGGFIGGSIDLLHKITYKEAQFLVQDEKYSRSVFLLLILRSGFIGVGGSLGLCAFRIYAGEFAKDISNTPVDFLFNFTLSIVAGFASRTLLPNIANRLERQLEDKLAEERSATDKKFSEQQRKIENQHKELIATSNDITAALSKQSDELFNQNEALNFLRNLSVGEFALQSTIPSDHKRGRHAFEENTAIEPTNRKCAILFGRLLREKYNDADGAIRILTNALYARDQAGIPPDADYADILYNRACYSSIRAQELAASSEAASPDWISRALADLKQSVGLSPENRLDATSDPDFDFIAGRDDFKAIVSSS